MIDPTDRDTLEDWMVRYVVGDLAGAEASEMERLLDERRELRVEADRLRRTLGLMPFAVVTAPPAALRTRILAAAQHIEQPRPAARASVSDVARNVRVIPVPRSADRPTIRRVVGSIAAMLIVALAWDAYRLRQELQLQQDVATTLQQPNVVRQFALRGTGVSLAAGTAVLDLDAKRAAVAIRGLPKLPAGQVYRLWARVGDGTVPCGQFNADAEGTVLSRFTIPVDAYTSPVRELFLNIEPLEAGPHPVGRTVMVGT
jgi:hypothetical protein